MLTTKSSIQKSNANARNAQKQTALTATKNTASKLYLYHNAKTHNFSDCKKFRELDISERKNFHKKNRLCYKCGVQNKHLAASCDAAAPKCDVCEKSHLTVLHMESKLSANTSSSCTQVCGEEAMVGRTPE